MSAPTLTEGRRRVAELVKRVGAAEFGRRVRSSEAMIRHIATGRKTPGAALKTRIAEVFGVAVESWSRPARPKTKKKPIPPAPSTEPSPTRTARQRVSGIDQLCGVLDRYDDLIREADRPNGGTDDDEHVVGTSIGAWVQLLRGKAEVAHMLAKLLGEGELTVATIVRSRAWAEILKALEPVLADAPDVAAKMADVLAGLGAA